MVRARWRWRGSRCVARVRSSALFLAAHKHKSARPARCCVVCCVFWFLGPPRALFCSISQHTGQVLRLPLGHPAGTVLRFLVFRPGLGSVSPNIAAHRRGSCFMLVDAHLSAPHYPSSSHPHLLPMSHSFPARRLSPSPLCVLRFPVFSLALDPVSSNIAAHRWGFASALGYPAGTVLRFRGIQGEIGPKKPDIAAHRPRRDAVWMEAQVLGADAGARVRGVWRRVEACGSAGKRHIGSGRGAAGMLYGVRASRRKSALTREYR